MTRNGLDGRRVLVVEDEFFLALDMEERLQATGAFVVGPVPSIADALGLMAIARRLDAAVLDINLGGEMVYPLADHLIAEGVPVVFATGYSRGDIPDRFGAVPYCEKPFTMESVAQAIGDALR